MQTLKAEEEPPSGGAQASTSESKSIDIVDNSDGNLIPKVDDSSSEELNQKSLPEEGEIQTPKPSSQCVKGLKSCLVVIIDKNAVVHLC